MSNRRENEDRLAAFLNEINDDEVSTEINELTNLVFFDDSPRDHSYLGEASNTTLRSTKSSSSRSTRSSGWSTSWTWETSSKSSNTPFDHEKRWVPESQPQ